MRNHWNALRKRKGRQEVLAHSVSNAQHPGCIGFSLVSPVPAVVVVRPISIVLTVGQVVLLLVADQVIQRKSVVTGDEVDARVRASIVGMKDVAGAGKTRSQLGNLSFVSAPKAAHAVAVAPVPLRPAGWKTAQTVATGTEIPRLGDQLDRSQHRIL